MQPCQLPDRIVLGIAPEPKLTLEFSGKDRELTVRDWNGNVLDEQSRTTNYELKLEMAKDGAVNDAVINGITVGYITHVIEGDVKRIQNPRISVDGKEMDMLTVWKQFARCDKRFVIKQRKN